MLRIDKGKNLKKAVPEIGASPNERESLSMLCE